MHELHNDQPVEKDEQCMRAQDTVTVVISLITHCSMIKCDILIFTNISSSSSLVDKGACNFITSGTQTWNILL